MSECRVEDKRRAVRIVDKEVADGRKSLSEQVISSPQVRVMGVGIILPEANAPHLVKWVGVSLTLVIRTQMVVFISGFSKHSVNVPARTEFRALASKWHCRNSGRPVR